MMYVPSFLPVSAVDINISPQEFVIRTRRSRYEDVYVSRRYGDFRTLANEVSLPISSMGAFPTIFIKQSSPVS